MGLAKEQCSWEDLAESSYNCFHPGALVGLGKDGFPDNTEK